MAVFLHFTVFFSLRLPVLYPIKNPAYYLLPRFPKASAIHPKPRYVRSQSWRCNIVTRVTL